MEGDQDLKEMGRVVNALPKESRIQFAMQVSGVKYREIADKLGLPLGTVKSRIYFTRQRLQEELKDFRQFIYIRLAMDCHVGVFLVKG